VGKLGEITFRPGFYVYVGSGMANLEKRVKHHQLKKKSYHYHIDFITPTYMKIKKPYLIRITERIESELAVKIEKVCDEMVQGFGCSDTKEKSHLFYFQNNPLRNHNFYKIILDFRVL
jgi:sugar fermentation stimulation protein A